MSKIKDKFKKFVQQDKFKTELMPFNMMCKKGHVHKKGSIYTEQCPICDGKLYRLYR